MKRQIVALVVLAVLISATFCANAQSIGGFDLEFTPDSVLATYTYTDVILAPSQSLWFDPEVVPSEGMVITMSLSGGASDEYSNYNVQVGSNTYTADDAHRMSVLELPIRFSKSPNNPDGLPSSAYVYWFQPYITSPYNFRDVSCYIVNMDSNYRSYDITLRMYRVSLDTSEAYTRYYNNGFQAGYNDGLADGQTTSQTLDGFLVDVFAALATFFSPLMDFEIWGVNLVSVLALLVAASLALIIMRMRK